MHHFNLTEKDLENLYNVSQDLDNIGNFTLGVATILGLVSIDIVFLAIIFLSKDKKNHDRDNTHWELFFFSRWYSDRYFHHCCHDSYHHSARRMSDDHDDNFFVTTVMTSMICTAVAIILALHFHLLTLAIIFASVWGAAFAIKSIAYIIRPNLPEAEVFSPTPSAPPIAYMTYDY